MNPGLLPRIVRVLRVLIGVQIYRLYGLSLLQAPALPSVFTIPAVTGDVLTAVFAPVIAYAIGRKRGPRTWAAAIVWNVLGLVDLFYALTLGSLTNAASYILMNNILVLVGATLGIVLHTVSIILLLRKSTVDYFLNRV